MLKDIFGAKNTSASKNTPAGRDIVVRIVSPENRPAQSKVTVLDVEREYSNETKPSSKLVPIQGLTAGAGIGIVVAVAAAFVGVSLNIKDLSVIVGIPAVLGMIAGYLFS